MATASVSFGAIGGNIPAAGAGDFVSEIFTPTASNQTTTSSTTANKPVVRVASDVALYVSFGASPNATSDASRFYLPAGSTEYFTVTAGVKAALVTA